MTDRPGSWRTILRARLTLHPSADGHGEEMTLLRESHAGFERKVEELSRELKRARDHQAAISEVLRVTSTARTDVQPVLDTVVERAAALCDAPLADLLFVEGDKLRVMSRYSRDTGTHPGSGVLVPIGRDHVNGRVVLERRTIHIEDIVPLLDTEYRGAREDQRQSGFRTALGVPLLREGNAIGTISLTRREARLFSEEQLALLQTFAEQAVIAIENVRLLSETKEALEHRTATAEILKVINRSSFDLQTVLDTLVQSAARLCDADHAWLFRRDRESYRWAASFGHATEHHERIKQYMLAQEIFPGRGTMVGRTALEGRAMHIADVTNDPEYKWNEAQRIGDYRTVLDVPLLREGVPIGVLGLTRSAVRPFTDKQIELATTFADQAVVAIENVRLFKELQARNRDLTEALEQQTATSEILRVISSSPTDAQPVFDLIARSAMTLCNARYCLVCRVEGDFLHLASDNGFSSEELLHYYRGVFPLPVDAGSTLGRAVMSRTAAQIPDIAEDPHYGHARHAQFVGVRSVLAVPMLRDGRPLGAIAVSRAEPGRYSDAQAELLRTFADQAVIAIENARLFEELQTRTLELTEALDRQTATSDALKTISRSAFDLRPVLQTLIEITARLCRASKGVIYEYDGKVLRPAAYCGFELEFEKVWQRIELGLDRASGAGRAALERRMVQIPDVLADPEYALTEGQRLGGWRSLLCVPLLREEQVARRDRRLA